MDMRPADFEKTVLTIFGELMAQEHLRRVESSHERAFSTVLVGNEHAGIRVLLEWRELHVEVKLYRCRDSRPPPPSPLAPSPYWLSLEELAETGSLHPLELPLLTASRLSDEGVSEVTPQDVVAYLADVVPILKAVGAPWFRGRLESFEAAIRARDALLAEPELSDPDAPHLRLAEGTAVYGQAPAFIGGLLEACALLLRAGWRDVWYGATPRHLAMALADPRRQLGLEVRVRGPRPVELQVELLLIEDGRPPAQERLDRRVAIRWALEARGLPVPVLDRGAGVGLYSFVAESVSALTQANPGLLSGDTRVLQEAQARRKQMEERLGAEFR